MLKLLPLRLRLLLSACVAFACVFLDTGIGGNYQYAIALTTAILGAAGIGAGSSLIGGLLGKSASDSAAQANLQAARETNKLNEKLFNQQISEQWRMWQAENAYNTPAEQRKRLLAAGINPQLALENSGNLGQASSMTAPSAPQMQQPSPQVPYDYNPMMQGLREAATTALQYGVQAQSLAADARLKNSQAAINEVDAQTRNAMNMASLQKTMNDSKLSVWQRNLARQQYNFLKATEQYRIQAESYQPDLQRQALAMAKEQTGLYRWQALSGQLHDLLDIREDSRRGRELQQSLVESRARVGLMAANKFLTEKQASHEIQKEAETILRAVGIRQQNQHYVETKDLLIETLKTQLAESDERMRTMRYDREPGFNRIINFRWSDLP